jgi:hypothetical protein
MSKIDTRLLKLIDAAGLASAVLIVAVAAGPAQAEYFPILQERESLRNPLIPGAPYVPPFVAPQPGQAPPIGDGDAPAPVTPGQSGGPMPPPTAVYLPPVSPLDGDYVDQMLAPYLTPPPSTPGQDPGLLPGTGGLTPPAARVDINPQGGIQGQAPIKRWGGQTTRNLGLPRNGRGAMTTDYGQDIDTLPSVKERGIVRYVSEDGPRAGFSFPGRMGNQANHQSSTLVGAQESQDLHGNRVLYKGANLRSRMTIAPF